MITGTLSGWTSSTSVNATQTIFSGGAQGPPAVLLHLVQGSTISGGAITFEVSYDGTNFITISADAVIDPTSTTSAQISLPYTLVASTNKAFLLLAKGAQALRIKLSTAITGSATVTPNYELLPISPETHSSVNLAQVGGTTTVTGGTAGTQGVGGIQAHDAADSGNNPIKIGAKATSSEPAAVSSADVANLITDLVGKLIVLPYANPENFVSGAITTAMTSTTTTSLVAAPGSGLRNYLTTIIVSNAHASVGTDVIIQDGSGGTTLMTIPAASVYGGAVITLPTPLRQPTTNTAIHCANVTTGASVKVSAVGYKGA